MKSIEITLPENIITEATRYANERGVNLSTIIETYLTRIVQTSKRKKTDADIANAISCLLGAGNPISNDDINGREAYQKYLLEKYK